ncbi:hypothetical protein KP509_1Z098000 [Ceratopteris richardii]|nr:hypothetical protein KP509_1Z098000 [Ceratopteris richardii]
MSGGFFRGTSADQDTRFSNKTAKLLKTQKFAPELDQLIDMTKVHLDSMRPWIANRVTQLLGFEDEVLINFIYGLLEEKIADGKQIQIQLTGFMEKNTGKFMRELWGLLISAMNSTTGIPQQLLDEKAEEARLKKAEEQRVISEVRRKEDERRAFEQESSRKAKDEQMDLSSDANPSIADLKQRARSPSRGRRSLDDYEGKIKNGVLDSRPSQTRSVSNLSSKSISRSRRSRSPPRHARSPPRHARSPNLRHRSRSPNRRHRSRSPNRRHRSRSPPRRGVSPVKARSPRRRRRRSYSHSPRQRSPIPVPRSPKRKRSPRHSRSPRGRSSLSPHRRSPVFRSPRRRHSPVYSRPSPRRRKSPPSPRRRQSSPHVTYSPIHHHRRASSPGRYHYTPTHDPDFSPRRRPRVSSSPRHISLSPRPHSGPQSLSPEVLLKSPLANRQSSSSPQRLSSPSPSHQSMQCLSPAVGKSSYVASHKQELPLHQGRPLRDSVSPGGQNKSTYQYHSSHSPSLRPSRNEVVSLHNVGRSAAVTDRALSPSSSPPRQQTVHSLSHASSRSGKSRSPSGTNEVGWEKSLKSGQMESRKKEQLSINGKRTRSSSREPSERRESVSPKRSSENVVGYRSPMSQYPGKFHEPTSRFCDDDPRRRPDQRPAEDIQSDENEEHGPMSPASHDDKHGARKRKKERRLKKEEKRRRREERHKRKEERRAIKASLKGVPSVTPPPGFLKYTEKSDGSDSGDEEKVLYDGDAEIEQRKLEDELRRKALDSIKAKKCQGL